MFSTEKQKTGYPSIDKPWLKFYDKALNESDIPECSAYHLLYQNNKDYMDDVALIYFNRKIKFKELFENIRKTAMSLTALGIGKGDIVTLQVLNMPQTVYLFYALSYIGAVANMIYFSASVKETNEILINTKSKMYIAIDSLWETHKESVKGTDVQHVLLLKIAESADVVTRTIVNIKLKAVKAANCMNWKQFLKYGSISEIDEVNESRIPVVMVYTGGTTGKSKAVVLSSQSMNGLVYQYNYALPELKRGGKLMNSIPPFVAYGIVVDLHMPLCRGIKNILILDPSPENAASNFYKYCPNYYICGCPQNESIMNHPGIQKMNLDFIKVFAVGGDTVTPAFEERANKFFKNHNADTTISVGYGMTEAAATVVTSLPKVSRVGTVGIPLPGTIIKVVEPDTINELPYNHDGEICFSTPTMMLGYYKNEEETNNIIKVHNDGKKYIHSGDIGHIDEDGFVTISGRIKRIIATWGNNAYHKVFPKLIEDMFVEIEGIHEVSIVGRKITNVFCELIAFVVLDKGNNKENTERLLRNISDEKLDTWERPVEYRFIDALPRTTIGKVNYRELEKEINDYERYEK